jgi:hypothetical protein
MRKRVTILVVCLLSMEVLGRPTDAMNYHFEENLNIIQKEIPNDPVDKNLFDTIVLQDSLLFAAFNARDLEKMKAYFSIDLEVYQDNTGVRSFEETIAAFQGLFEKDYVLTRELEAGTMEVYPIKDFGAIETGKHTFSHIENGKLEEATFKFVHIWEKKDGGWKITRLITYDHK